MKMRFAILLFICTFFFGQDSLQAQTDPVLFSLDNKEVLLSEFQYIYSKTNGDTTSYSKASLAEYLELYKKFKLKVAAAREMKLDTIPSLQQELAGYRRQLADSYLTDREVTEKLVKEAYDRSQSDLGISHVLIAVGEKASPADTLVAYNKAMTALANIKKGETFETVVKNFSDDKISNGRGGSLGYLVAPFPNGFYALENAAYENKVGEVSGPVRTSMGYHLVKVTEERKARGEVELAHILFRTDAKNPSSVAKAQQMADSIYQVLQKGGNFGELARQYSTDKATAQKDGYIGFFGINRYEKSFEDQAFALAKDGDLSKPIKSSVGIHILKRMSLKRDEPFKIAKRRLQPKIQKDGRFELAKEVMIERIKKEGNYMESPGVLDNWLKGLDETFLTFKWKPAAPANQAVLAYFGESIQRTLNDFEKFCQKNSRQRIRKSGNVDPQEVGKDLYHQFANQMCLDFEESQLEQKYPDFKSLMREYEEGILLFEATKLQVWDKASQDTVGLKKYYAAHKNDFKWKERARINEVSVHPDYAKLVKKIRKTASKKGVASLDGKFNVGGKTVIAVQEKTVEKGRDAELDAIAWTVGNLTPNRIDEKTKHTRFSMIEEIIAPSPKPLEQSRGYVIADYQDQLEKEWIKELSKKYPIKVNQAAFNSLIKE